MVEHFELICSTLWKIEMERHSVNRNKHYHEKGLCTGNGFSDKNSINKKINGCMLLQEGIAYEATGDIQVFRQAE